METSTQMPFYANTEDDMRCFQATTRMVLGYFLPERNFDWEELDEMSNHHEGLSTWPQKMLTELAGLDFDVKLVEGFDGRDFIRRGEQYLIDAFGAETAQWQIKYSNIDEERQFYQLAYDRGVNIENRLPDLDEMAEQLADDYAVICTVNSRKLNNQPGYVGHSVVILSINDNEVVLHDPGLPPQPERHVSRELFEQAWADPNENAKNYIAIKPKEQS